MTVSWNNKFYLKIYNYEINNLLNHTTFLEKSNRYNIFTGTVPPAGAVLFFVEKTDPVSYCLLSRQKSMAAQAFLRSS